MLREGRVALVSVVAAALLLIGAGDSRAEDDEPEATAAAPPGRDIQPPSTPNVPLPNNPSSPGGTAAGAAPGVAAPAAVTEGDVHRIIGQYLQDNPGAGMPSGIQTGYVRPDLGGGGFYFRSVPNPAYNNWKDLSRIPFQLNIGGMMQADYYYYKVTDSRNHLTGVDTRNNDTGDLSNLSIKRARLIFTGNVFSEDLRYNITFDGNTRGNFVTAGPPVLGTGLTGVGGAAGPAGGTAVGTYGPVARLYDAWVAYDMHPLGSNPGCGPDCPAGTYRYQPTLTAFVGKAQPFFTLEETLGARNQQFVEYSMATYFFDSDNNNQLLMAGFQGRAFDDRLFFQAVVTNGASGVGGGVADLTLTNIPGGQVGAWYDLGGTWDPEKQRWQLFGYSISDIDYSCNPVARVGFATNLVPMGRRSQYQSTEQAFFRVTPGAPNGTQVIDLLNGDSRGTTTAAGTTTFAVDAYDVYTYDIFFAGKFRGLSLYNEWWIRDINNIRGTHNGVGGNNPILYSSGLGGPGVTTAALFPFNRGLLDYGQSLQAGYFLIPKKLEIAGRWSWIRGESGDINGRDTKFTLVTVPGVPGGPVKVIGGAFRNFSEVNEYAVGINYYFYGQLVKWQTDFSIYNGGNPAQGGAAFAGFIPGVDGWMVRTQIQLAF
jgi:hypothetical protein